MQSTDLEPAPSFFPEMTFGNMAAGVAGLGLVALNRQNTKSAERHYAPLGKFVTVCDTKLHYLEQGTGPVVVLIHGNGTMLQDWLVSGVFDELARDHRVIAFDRPGFGHSTRPRNRFWTPRTQADVLAQALVQLGVKHASVVGHSLAALVAATMALDHPALVSRLTLLSGYFYSTPRFDALLAIPQAMPFLGDLIGHTLSPLLGKAMEPLVNHQLFGPDPVPKRWVDHFPMALSLRPSQLRASAADSAMMLVAASSLSGRYAELALPVTIIAGLGDRIVRPAAQSERFHADVPQTELRLLAGSGHMLHHANREIVVEAASC